MSDAFLNRKIMLVAEQYASAEYILEELLRFIPTSVARNFYSYLEANYVNPTDYADDE